MFCKWAARPVSAPIVVLQIAYASEKAVSGTWVSFFCGTKHAKRPKHWPPAVCFTGVQCRLARSGSDAASADAHSTMSTPHTLRARLSLLHSTDAPHLRLVRRAGQLVQARVMTLFGLSAADPRGNLEGVAVLTCTDFWPAALTAI